MTISFAALDAVTGRRALFLMAGEDGPVVGGIHKGKTLDPSEAARLWHSRKWQRVANKERIQPTTTTTTSNDDNTSTSTR